MTDAEVQQMVAELVHCTLHETEGILKEVTPEIVGALTATVADHCDLDRNQDGAGQALILAFVAGIIYERQKQTTMQFNMN